MFLAGVRIMHCTRLDDRQHQIVIAVLDVIFVTDELRRCGDEGRGGYRPKPHKRTAVVYRVGPHNPACKILPEH